MPTKENVECQVRKATGNAYPSQEDTEEVEGRKDGVLRLGASTLVPARKTVGGATISTKVMVAGGRGGGVLIS